MYQPSVLLEPVEPWVFRTLDAFAVVLDSLVKITHLCGINIVILDGGAMRDATAFYDELVRGFRLPNYFGRNLNALDECLCDLEWLAGAGFILVVKRAADILRFETSEKLDGFVDVLRRAGREWSQPEGPPRNRPVKPFHSIFHCSSEGWRAEIPPLDLILDSTRQP